MKGIEGRLGRIENGRRNPVALVWIEDGETPEQAEARYLAAHPHHKGEVTVLGWSADEGPCRPRHIVRLKG